jgi:hypothetical protein
MSCFADARSRRASSCDELPPLRKRSLRGEKLDKSDLGKLGHSKEIERFANARWRNMRRPAEKRKHRARNHIATVTSVKHLRGKRRTNDTTRSQALGKESSSPSSERRSLVHQSNSLRRKNAQRRNPTPTEEVPPPPSLNTNPGSRSGALSPSGEATQGPSLVDYSLEIEAIFPFEMVIEMQKCAAQKARKTIIGRTLGGKATFKALQDCLKLLLPAPFSTITLLTRGYFEILFEDEEGARATRKLAAVEWSGCDALPSHGVKPT